MLLFSGHQSGSNQLSQECIEISDQPCDIRSHTICLESGSGEQAKDLPTLRNFQRPTDDGFFTALFGVVFDVTHFSLTSRFHLQDLDRFGQDQLAIDPLGSSETNLAIGSIQLVQALERPALAIGNPVVAEVTKGDDLCRRGKCRNIS